MKHLYFILGFLAFILLAGPSHADVQCVPQESPVVQGVIKPGDFESLIRCLERFTKAPLAAVRHEERTKGGATLSRVGWVYFNTPGGDVNEAIKMGRFLREALAEVVVTDKCLSSCFLAVAGAVKLLTGPPFGRIGIHRVYYPAETLRSIDSHQYELLYNKIKSGMSDYLRDLDVPQRFVDLMFSVPSNNVYYLSSADYASLNQHPAYDEWIAARCHNNAVEDAHGAESQTRNREFESCASKVRWATFVKTVQKYYQIVEK